jgi:hypothetical protein
MGNTFIHRDDAMHPSDTSIIEEYFKLRYISKAIEYCMKYFGIKLNDTILS